MREGEKGRRTWRPSVDGRGFDSFLPRYKAKGNSLHKHFINMINTTKKRKAEELEVSLDGDSNPQTDTT